MNKCLTYIIKPGAYVVVWLTGQTRKYIAEVMQVTPVRMKVVETGPWACLKEEDFIIADEDTMQIQGDQKRQNKLLLRYKFYGRPLLSGLKSLGIEDGKIHEIWPDSERKSAKLL